MAIVHIYHFTYAMWRKNIQHRAYIIVCVLLVGSSCEMQRHRNGARERQTDTEREIGKAKSERIRMRCQKLRQHHTQCATHINIYFRVSCCNCFSLPNIVLAPNITQLSQSKSFAYSFNSHIYLNCV